MDKFNQREELTYGDSWKEKSVELATTGAIVAAAGTLAVKGNLHDSLKYGKQALKQSHKGFENYIKRRSNPVTRLLYNTGKKTFNTISREKKMSSRELLEAEVGAARTTWSDIKDADVIALAAKKQATLEAEQKHLRDTAKMLNQDPPQLEKIDPIKLQEEARNELFNSANKQNGRSNTIFGTPPGVKSDTDKMTSEFVGGAITGLGVGSGITAIHAVDKMTRGNNNNSRKDQSFEIAGTFIPSERKKREGERQNMNKAAGYRDVYDSLSNIGGKIPQAAATGVGFTGVSLGTAEMLKRKREQEKQNDAANKQNRIIIEFGADDLENKDVGSHANLGGTGMMARPNFDKLASFNNFLKNVGGRSSEIRTLKDKTKNFDYQAAAADSLKNENVSELAKARYGHVLPSEKAGEKILEERGNLLRNQDRMALEGIQDDVAKARLVTGGTGLGLAGLGATGMAFSNKKEEELNGQRF